MDTTAPTPQYSGPTDPDHIVAMLEIARDGAALDIPADQWAEFTQIASQLVPIRSVAYDNTDGPPLPTVDELAGAVAAAQANVRRWPAWCGRWTISER